MERFDEIVSTKIEDGKATVEQEPNEDTLQSEAMQEACAAFVQAERRFRKLDSNPDCVTDKELNVKWWDALEALYQCDKRLWELFVGADRSPRSNKMYNKFRERLIAGKRLRVDA